MNVTIRPCVPNDAATLVGLIRDLAVYERLEDAVRMTADALREHLFGPRPWAEALLAEIETEPGGPGEPVGFALFFPSYSTFRGQPGLFLEDLFVREEYRGRGIGRALLASVARLAVERGCGRLEWAVLHWNAPAIGFYRAIGARALDDWTAYRLDEESLDRLAGQVPASLVQRAESSGATGGLPTSVRP